MKDPKRPKRFVVIPVAHGWSLSLRQDVSRRGFLEPQARGERPLAGASGTRADQTFRVVAKRFSDRPLLAAPLKPTGKLKVVRTSPPDGAILVQGAATAAQVKAQTAAGAKVFEEQWYRLERPARPWMKQSASLKKPRVSAANALTWTITVKAEGEGLQPLMDAMVTVMTNEAKGIGLELTTDRHGRAKFALSGSSKQVEAVYVEPLHGGWPVALRQVAIASEGLTVVVPPIDLKAPDVRGAIYGKPLAKSGEGVVVGIVDTGVGQHDDIDVAGGMNVTGELKKRYGDEDGHGTHVAGVIASSAAGWRRGEASKVQLRAYRIFKSGEEFASTFDIATAIKQAAADGCDLINLSIGGAEDGTVKDAIELAWQAGCVCVAATGNDGKDAVDYPARYRNCIAVSAIGLDATWPTGASIDWTVSNVKGKLLSDRASFFASFSNRGPQVCLTAPGVAVVSTIFDNRWGVMSGTSMATPVATGVLARRLAASAVLKMPRDARRSEAIVALARTHAEDLQLTANRQGSGLAR